MVGSKNGPLHQGRRGGYDAYNHWVDEPPLIEEDERRLPETVPHEYLGTHTVKCKCAPCVRFPDQELLKALKVRSGARRRG